MNETFKDLETEFGAARNATEAFSVSPDADSDEEFTAARKRLVELREKLVSPLEKKLHLKEQYESQKKILTDTGILEMLSSGKLGIKDKDGNEYPFPSLLDIKKRVGESKEIIEQKLSEGFSRLLITPFAVPLDVLHEKLVQNLLRHSNENKILALKTDPSSPDVSVPLDKTLPINFPGGFKVEELVYEPEEFTKQHNGKTKEEVISSTGAWQISFIENLPALPGSGEGKVISGRKQVEAWLSPEEYFQLLRNPEYKGETGTTPEDWVVFALTYLEETNQLIDDAKGSGKASMALGTYFPNEASVPNEGFVRSILPSRPDVHVNITTCRQSESMIFNSTRTRVRI